MTHASLFSGIGGFDLAAEWMGWENLFHCEWNPFGQQVLKHHFPNSISYNDITKTDFSIHNGSVDILTGGFPCQPYSAAGKRLGNEDERHLWPEMLRTIQEVQPRWVVGENVLGLVNWNGGLVFEEVQTDLEAKGYEVQAYVLPAAGVNAPHQRYRVWFVAYSNLYNDKRKVGNINGKEKRIPKEYREEYSSSREFSGTNFSNVTNSNLYGQQQKRRYDCGSENVDGCNNEKFGTTNSKDINRRSSYRDFEKQYGISTGVSVKGIYETNETTDTTGICRMDKDNRDSKTSFGENKLEDDKSRTLVQNGQSGFQLPINGGLEYIKNVLSSSEGFRSQNDLFGINRMERNASNTNEIGLSAKMENGELGRKFGFTKRDERNMWNSFPTEPPICGGNDGISEELDSISLSKWRKESLMAYGNAIVPQVAHQIFKAIQEFELMVNK